MLRNFNFSHFNKVSQFFMRPTLFAAFFNAKPSITKQILQLFVRPARFMVLLMPLLVLLAGCSGVQYTEKDEELGQISWENLQNLNGMGKSNSGPYNASLSFRLKTPKDSFMLGAYVWSNGQAKNHHPLRLDLQSSAGSSVAKLKEESDHFLLYDISNNVAVISRGAEAPLAALGLPLPFSLGDLSLLLNGRYLDFFNAGDHTRPELASTTLEQQSVFSLPSGHRQGYLTLNSYGYPVSWQSADEKPWSMTLVYQDAATLLANTTPLPGPSRISLSHPDGYALTINVKSLKKLPAPFTADQLELRIPAAAEIREIETEAENI